MLNYTPSKFYITHTLAHGRCLFALLIAVFICLTIFTEALADGRYYNSDDTIQTRHPDWMSWMPDAIKLSELSIPGSHDTMSFYGGDLIETQGLPLDKQLDAGIRVLDIRAVHVGNRFAIFHGCYFQKAYFEDVLRIAAEFLKSHKQETIIMMLGDDGYKKSCPVVGEIFEVTPPIGTYSETFELYRDKREKGSFIWNPQIERTHANNNYYANAVAGPSYAGQIPTLGEVRGKIVIIERHGFARWCALDCDQESGKGWKYPKKYYGIGNSASTLRIYEQFNYNIDWTWEIRDQAERAIDFLKKTDAGSSDFKSTSGAGGADAMYINQLNGVDETSGLPGVYPYTAAGGDGVGTSGVNEIVLDYLMRFPHEINRTTGIMRMDFPGAALIDAIIAHNFRFREKAKPITALASDFGYMFNNIAYDGTEFGGPTQALYRHDRLKLFVDHVLPDQGMNYFVAIDSLAHGGIFDNSELYKLTDWIDTDNVLETREYRAIAFNTKSPSNYTNEELKAFVDDVVDSEVSGSWETVYNSLYGRLVEHFPKSNWSVFAKDGDGGFDNWAYSVSGLANFYRKSVGATDFVVVGTGRNCPIITQPISLNATFAQDGRPLFSWSPVENAQSYDIVVRDADDNIVLEASRTATSYMPDTQLAPGTYQFSVRGVNVLQGECKGPYSNLLSVTIAPPPPANVQLIIEVVSIDASGLGSGAIAMTPAPVSQVGGNYYTPGSVVTLTAKPTIRSEFAEWGGTAANCGTLLNCNVTIAEGMAVKAIFKAKPRLTVDYQGDGTVARSPWGNGCPSSTPNFCEIYSTGDTVMLTATPREFSTFDHWSGDPDCSDGSVTMNENKLCTAVFTKTDYQLSVMNSGGGVVVSDAVGAIDCGSDCAEVYPVNAGQKTVVLTATPEPDHVFVRWYGAYDCWDEDENDGNPSRISVTVGVADVSCSAAFVAAGTEYALTVEKISGGAGSVTAEAVPAADSSGIDCLFAACSQTYPVNSQIQLKATPARGSVFAGWDGDPDCVDGQVSMTRNIRCSARFTAKILLVDGSDDSTLRNEYISVLNAINDADYDEWSVQSPNSTSNPGGRTEPIASDLAPYSRVIWYTGNASETRAVSPAAGPSEAAEADLAEYLDNGGCLLFSSPQYYLDRGLTSVAQSYLGVSGMTNNVEKTQITGAGDLSLGFSNLGPYRLKPSDAGLLPFLSDAIMGSPAAPGINVLFRFTDGGEAAIATDNGIYRTAFLGFPFLALGSGSERINVMSALLDYCGQIDRDDVFEANDDFIEAVGQQGAVSLKDLKILPGNDDYFRWVSDWYADARFSISFAHASGDLTLEVYDKTHKLIASSQSQDDNEEVVVADVDAGQTYFIRVYGLNGASNHYALEISATGSLDRDHDGVVDADDALPEDPTEQFDADGDFIGDNADIDDDNDGMLDSFELFYGFNPLSALDASEDSDLDGFTNLEESNFQSDPLDSNSNPATTDCLFDWAETDSPALYAPPGAATVVWSIWTYRYYLGTNIYLGISSEDKHLYSLGADGNLQDLGLLSDWLAKAGCQHVNGLNKATSI